MSINGMMGTNVWVVPTNPTLMADPADPTNKETIVNPVYENNYADVYLVSRYFDIETLTRNITESPYKVKYDYRNVGLKLNDKRPTSTDSEGY
jgi:hypothetical protein